MPYWEFTYKNKGVRGMRLQDNEKGFTLIELIVVVAIMGIIGAVLVPQFTTMSLRSRMSADVSAVKVLQNQVDIYYADTGTWPGAGEDGKVKDAEDVIEALINDNCIDDKYLEASDDSGSNKRIHLQTGSAKLQYSQEQNRLFLTVSEEDYKKVRSDNADRLVWIIDEDNMASLKKYITNDTNAKDTSATD